MRIIAFDPGESTGWCTFNDNQLGEFGILRGVEELYPFLDSMPARWKLDTIIVENYKVRPVNKAGYSHMWSSVGPARMIGAIQFLAWMEEIEFVLQEPSDKPVGARLMGMSAKPTKGKHHQDAMCHAVVYLHRKGLWKQ